MSQYRPATLNGPREAATELWREARALRRIALLLERAQQDCGARHEELSQIGRIVQHLSSAVTGEPMIQVRPRTPLARELDSLTPLVETLSKKADDCDGGSCDVLTTDLIAELRELRQRIDRQSRRLERGRSLDSSWG